MLRRLGSVALLGTLLLGSGCSLCCAPYDCNYLYTGGRWVRDNPTSGRVGSVFEPAGTRVEGDAHGEPLPIEAMPVPDGTQSVMPRRPATSGAELLPVE